MTIEEMRTQVDSAINKGLLFEHEGVLLSSADGYNQAAVAVVGTLLMQLGKPSFNAYARNQLRALGWLYSRSNPIASLARRLRGAAKALDPSAGAIMRDVSEEFIEPILREHKALGGADLSDEEWQALVAMLAAKLLWDLDKGNPNWAVKIRMFGSL